MTTISTPKLNRPIIVVCPPFDENSGGAIVLHYLVDQLRGLGADAYARRLPEKEYANIRWGWLRDLKKWNGRRREKPLKTHTSMDVPLAPPTLYDEAIHVYPETVEANPFKSQRVARWLLHKPAFFNSVSEIDLSEEIFFYQEAFADGIEGISAQNLLQVRWLREDIYRDLGQNRTGTCRMIRKGQGTYSSVKQPDSAIILDGKSHSEVAEIFNRTEIFYCHDPYTMYAYYAALCGCVPVVIPLPELSGEDWRSGFELKHGVAYGEEEIKWARETRGLLIEDMAAAKSREKQNILRFIDTLEVRFN